MDGVAVAVSTHRRRRGRTKARSIQDVPVTYTLDHIHGIIRTKCSGAITIEDVVEHFRELAQDPDCPDRLDVLLDLSEETSIPTRTNLQEVTREIHGIQGRVQFRRCAIVASTDALFGMLRMFEIFTEQYFRQTFVFRTTAEAEVWLASPQTARPIVPRAGA